jgi:hypothetical protein
MAWFRTNRGVAAWLALFALACQLAFSFGHVHLGKSSGGTNVDGAARIIDAAADGPSSSPQQNHGKLAFDFCAICANINVAGTLILPVLAVIFAPDLFTRITLWLPAPGGVVSFDHRPFGARGPPRA